MQLSPIANEIRQTPGYIEELVNCLRPATNKTITDWTIEQLDIRPYQHILEIGYASGYTLYEVARKLKIGFIAGIDESMSRWRQAYNRNKKLIRDQLMQLHIGKINELPYPHHYFHTIYANNLRLLNKEIKYELIPLVNLLKSGGKLVMIFQTAGNLTDKQIQQAAEKIEQDYVYAGLLNIQSDYRDVHPSGCVVVTGYKE